MRRFVAHMLFISHDLVGLLSIGVCVCVSVKK